MRDFKGEQCPRGRGMFQVSIARMTSVGLWLSFSWIGLVPVFASSPLSIPLGVPFSIPAPCQADSESNASAADIKIHQRSCSQAIPDLVQGILERNKTLIECTYLDYRIDLLKQETLSSTQISSVKQQSAEDKCKAMGVVGYRDPSKKFITCDLFADPPEENKNHLREACGPLSSGRALRGADSDGTWEKRQLAGIRLRTKWVTADRLTRELRTNNGIQVISPRCETRAKQYLQVLNQADEINTKIAKTQAGISLRTLARENRLCREDTATGDSSGVTQAACQVSAARGQLESAFAQLVACEILSQSDALYAKILDDEYQEFSNKLARCTARAERKARDDAWTESQARRIFKNTFRPCYERELEDFIQRLRSRYFSSVRFDSEVLDA